MPMTGQGAPPSRMPPQPWAPPPPPPPQPRAPEGTSPSRMPPQPWAAPPPPPPPPPPPTPPPTPTPTPPPPPPPPRAGAAAAAPAASVTTARAPPPRQHVVGEVCRYSRNGTVPKVDVTIKHIEPPLPDDTTEFFTIEFSTGDQRQVTGSELEPTTTTLSPEAAGDRVRASTAQPVTEEVTSTTKAFLGSAGPWMRNKIEKGKWPWWACMVEGPTDTAAGLHCKLCHEHAPLDFNGERSG